MLRFVVITVMLLGTIGFEEDNSPGSDVSRYQNTYVIPGNEVESTQLTFEFIHTYSTRFTLTIRFNNATYSNVLLYTQQFPTPRTVKRQLTIPSYLLLAANTFQLEVISGVGQTLWSLPYHLLPNESIHVMSIQSWQSQGTLWEINDVGRVVTYHERWNFVGFSGNDFHDVFGRFDVSSLRLIRQTYRKQVITVSHAYLLIETSPHFENMMIVEETWIFLPLSVLLIDDTLTFVMPTLYVDPFSLDLSDVPLEGYVSTHYFFFPHGSYPMHHHTTIKLILQMHHFLTFTLTYTFTYQAGSPLLGDCLISQYCVRVPYA